MEINTQHNRRNAQVHRYGRMEERALRKVVILGGSVVLCMVFSLIIAINVYDGEWDRTEKLISLVISAVGFTAFGLIIAGYLIHHVRKSRQSRLNDNMVSLEPTND